MEGTITPSEAIALSGNRGGYGGFGDGNGWWILIILFALWGGNGWGGFGGSGSGSVQQGYTLASDFATLERQLDSGFQGLERKGDFIQEQQCNSDQMMAAGFANVNTNLLTNAANLNNTLATNFATTNANLMNGFAGVNQGISSNRYENQLAINQLGQTFQECCCNQRVQSLENTNAIQTSLAGINYNMATNTNGIQNAISSGFCTSNYNNSNNTRDIIDAINTNARATQDMIMANRIEDKDQEIAQLRTMLNNANLAASQAAQTNAIDNRIDQLQNSLQPTARPAYIVANPYCSCNNGCGCGNYL